MSLKTEYPALFQEWHPTKNQGVDPSVIKPGSGKKVWWLGKCGHEWQAQILSRRNGSGCPYCANQKVLKGFNDLETQCPGLSKEWHPKKNGNLKPCDVVSKSSKKVWWRCGVCGHEWAAEVRSRYRGVGCPACAIERQKHIQAQPRNESSLAKKCPSLLREWHPVKNGDTTPKDVNAGSHKKAWWICSKCGHEWAAEIKSRYRGAGCPECGKKRTSLARSKPADGRSLSDLFPWLISEWNYEKNQDISPDKIAPKSEKKVWWKCRKGHSWCATVGSRTSGTGCPVCASEMQTSFPEQALVYYLSKYTKVENRSKIGNDEVDLYLPELNVGIEYDGCYFHAGNEEKDLSKELRLSERIKLYKVVEEIGSTFRVDGNRYIYNPRNNYSDLPLVVLSLLNALDLSCDDAISLSQEDRLAIYNQYFSKEKEGSLAALYPVLAEEFHPSKNGDLKPSYVKPGTQKKFWWLGKCGHEWEASVYSRVKGSKCPYCSGRLPIPGQTDLATTYPHIAKEWHYEKNGRLIPSNVKAGSNKKVWWVCERGHEWEAKIYNRTTGKQNCPYCSGQRLIPGETDLATCSPKLAAEWDSSKNDLQPNEVKPHSNRDVWWRCSKCGHAWRARIAARYSGNGCPKCRIRNK